MVELMQAFQTVAERNAFRAGVQTVAATARAAADRLADAAWRPTREGGADALRELADAFDEAVGGERGRSA